MANKIRIAGTRARLSLRRSVVPLNVYNQRLRSRVFNGVSADLGVIIRQCVLRNSVCDFRSVFILWQVAVGIAVLVVTYNRFHGRWLRAQSRAVGKQRKRRRRPVSRLIIIPLNGKGIVCLLHGACRRAGFAVRKHAAASARNGGYIGVACAAERIIEALDIHRQLKGQLFAGGDWLERQRNRLAAHARRRAR